MLRLNSYCSRNLILLSIIAELWNPAVHQFECEMWQPIVTWFIFPTHSPSTLLIQFKSTTLQSPLLTTRKLSPLLSFSIAALLPILQFNKQWPSLLLILIASASIQEYVILKLASVLVSLPIFVLCVNIARMIMMISLRRLRAQFSSLRTRFSLIIWILSSLNWEDLLQIPFS